MIKLIECPRDAMQGISQFIPTALKAQYINALLQVGFDTIDFGSFVSEKAIPQLKDTAEVLSKLNVSNTKSKLLAIVANQKGADIACQYNEISYLGFPFSISETFQKRNTNTTIIDSYKITEYLINTCVKYNKQAVIYISMAFGNPYNDDWNQELLLDWVLKLQQIGAPIIALSDTIGAANTQSVSQIISFVNNNIQQLELGAHLHSTKETTINKIEAAYNNGCKRFDGALKGFGGCPMAKDELVGNIDTDLLIKYFNERNLPLTLNIDKLFEAEQLCNSIFNTYH